MFFSQTDNIYLIIWINSDERVLKRGKILKIFDLINQLLDDAFKFVRKKLVEFTPTKLKEFHQKFVTKKQQLRQKANAVKSTIDVNHIKSAIAKLISIIKALVNFAKETIVKIKKTEWKKLPYKDFFLFYLQKVTAFFSLLKAI